MCYVIEKNRVGDRERREKESSDFFCTLKHKLENCEMELKGQLIKGFAGFALISGYIVRRFQNLLNF